MKSMCCLCIQFTHENTSERTILHLVKKKILGLVACTAKKASYALVYIHISRLMQSENGILLLFYIFLSHGNEEENKIKKN
jgi:hypothetical protein